MESWSTLQPLLIRLSSFCLWVGSCTFGAGQTVSAPAQLDQSVIGRLSPSFKIPLPVFIPIDTLQTQLQQSLFTENGRFYPCGKDGECHKQAGELYLESPVLSVDGTRLRLQAHLGGKVSGPFFTHPGVSSEITINGVPILEGNILRIGDVQLETSSSTLLFKFGAGRFREMAAKQIEDKVRYDLTPQLTSAKTRINNRVPFQWGNKCLGVELSELSLVSVVPASKPDGVLATFNAGIGLTSGDACHTQ